MRMTDIDFSFRRLEDAPLPAPTTLDLPHAIYGVLTVLPAPGTSWPDVEKAKFMAALAAVLDVVYPSPDNGREQS